MNTPTSSTTLKTYFETGDIPTESQCSDFVSSSPNIVDDNILINKNAAVIAVYPASQGTGTVITKKVTNISTAGAGTSGVTLVSMLIGNEYWISNNSGQTVNVYPPAGSLFSGLGINIPIKLEDGAMVHILCTINTLGSAILYRLPYMPKFTMWAKISQAGTSAPTYSVMKSDIPAGGTWARSSTGIYTFTLAGLFDTAKTYVTIESVNSSAYFATAYVSSSPNVITVETFNNIGVHVDSQLSNSLFKIEILN